MKISTRGRYGLRALVDLADHRADGLIALNEVAARQNISLNYLEQVFSILKKAGIVDSVKGAGGGYMLAREAEEITVEEVLTVLEGDFSIVDRIPENEMDVMQKAIQKLVWDRIDAEIIGILKESTVADLMTMPIS